MPPFRVGIASVYQRVEREYSRLCRRPSASLLFRFTLRQSLDDAKTLLSLGTSPVCLLIFFEIYR